MYLLLQTLVVNGVCLLVSVCLLSQMTSQHWLQQGFSVRASARIVGQLFLYSHGSRSPHSVKGGWRGPAFSGNEHKCVGWCTWGCVYFCVVKDSLSYYGATAVGLLTTAFYGPCSRCIRSLQGTIAGPSHIGPWSLGRLILRSRIFPWFDLLRCFFVFWGVHIALLAFLAWWPESYDRLRKSCGRGHGLSGLMEQMSQCRR